MRPLTRLVAILLVPNLMADPIGAIVSGTFFPNSSASGTKLCDSFGGEALQPPLVGSQYAGREGNLESHTRAAAVKTLTGELPGDHPSRGIKKGPPTGWDQRVAAVNRVIHQSRMPGIRFWFNQFKNTYVRIGSVKVIESGQSEIVRPLSFSTSGMHDLDYPITLRIAASKTKSPELLATEIGGLMQRIQWWGELGKFKKGWTEQETQHLLSLLTSPGVADVDKRLEENVLYYSPLSSLFEGYISFDNASKDLLGLKSNGFGLPYLGRVRFSALLDALPGTPRDKEKLHIKINNKDVPAKELSDFIPAYSRQIYVYMSLRSVKSDPHKQSSHPILKKAL